MKKYSINFSIDARDFHIINNINIIVEAKSIKEAKEKAESIMITQNRNCGIHGVIYKANYEKNDKKS